MSSSNLGWVRQRRWKGIVDGKAMFSLSSSSSSSVGLGYEKVVEVEAREGSGAEVEENPEVFEGDFGGWH